MANSPFCYLIGSVSNCGVVCYMYSRQTEKVGYGLKAKQIHAKTRRSKDAKKILCVFASLRLCVSVFLFRLFMIAT